MKPCRILRFNDFKTFTLFYLMKGELIVYLKLPCTITMELVTSKQIKKARRKALMLTKSNNKVPKNQKIIANVSSPVLSCARYANIQSRAGELSYALQQIDRPLPYSVHSIAFNQRNPLLGLTLREQWTYPPIHRLVSYGYNAESIANIIAAVPRSITDAIGQALRSLHGIVKSTGIRALHNRLAGWHQVAFPSDPKAHEAISVLKPGNETLWEFDTFRSIHRMTVDSVTQCRKEIQINPCTEFALGMHTEEFLSRLAAHDFPLPLTELDFIRIFLDLILGGVAVPGMPRARYIRITVGPSGQKKYLLVLWCTLSILGPDERVVEVLR